MIHSHPVHKRNHLIHHTFYATSHTILPLNVIVDSLYTSNSNLVLNGAYSIIKGAPVYNGPYNNTVQQHRTSYSKSDSDSEPYRHSLSVQKNTKSAWIVTTFNTTKSTKQGYIARAFAPDRAVACTPPVHLDVTYKGYFVGEYYICVQFHAACNAFICCSHGNIKTAKMNKQSPITSEQSGIWCGVPNNLGFRIKM